MAGSFAGLLCIYSIKHDYGPISQPVTVQIVHDISAPLRPPLHQYPNTHAECKYELLLLGFAQDLGCSYIIKLELVSFEKEN